MLFLILVGILALGYIVVSVIEKVTVYRAISKLEMDRELNTNGVTTSRLDGSSPNVSNVPKPDIPNLAPHLTFTEKKAHEAYRGHMF